MPEFTITIAQMTERTGYHRGSQERFRKAGVLIKGEHFKCVKSDLPNGRVMYDESAVKVLKSRRLTAKRGRPRKNDLMAI